MFTPNVKIKEIQSLYRSAIALSLLAVLLSSCKENISTIGSDYVNDSISRGSAVYSDANVLSFASLFKPTVSVTGRTYNLNLNSPYLFFGSVAAEGLSAWSVIKIPFIQDSVGQVLDDSLVLSMSNALYYGTSGSTLLEFDVYIATGVTDSEATLTSAQLAGAPVAHFSGMVATDSVLKVVLQLDTSRILPLLRTTQLALAIVPTANMNSVRAFASNDNGSALLSPSLKLLVAGANGNYTTSRSPEYDFHIVTESASAAPGVFELRGSTAQREQIVVNTKYIRTQLDLNPFTTINSGVIQITTDPAQHTYTSVPLDSALPALIYRDSITADSIGAVASFGARSASDPNVIEYQIRTIIEYAIRHGLDSLVFELRNGYGSRSFGGTSMYVEDYNLDRWIVYGQSATEEAKRPKLLVTFSYLK